MLDSELVQKTANDMFRKRESMYFLTGLILEGQVMILKKLEKIETLALTTEYCIPKADNIKLPKIEEDAT